MRPFQPHRTFLGVSACPGCPYPRWRSSEAQAASGSSDRGTGRWWLRTGQGRSLSLASREAPGSTPCAVHGTPGGVGESRAPGCSPGCQAGQEHRLSHGKEVPHGDLWLHPAPCAPSASPTSPSQTVDWKTRPGPGKGARAGGGAETRRDPLGPSLVPQPWLCPCSALVPAAFGLGRCVPGPPGGSGPLLAGLAEPRLGAESWRSQSQQQRDGENACPGRSLSGFSRCPGRELPGRQTWGLENGRF